MSKRFLVNMLTLVLGALAIYTEEPFGVVRFDVNEETEENVMFVARPELLRRKAKRFKKSRDVVAIMRNY